MTRLCIGIYLLASSWVVGTDYFYPPNYSLWLLFVLAGTLAICWSQIDARDSEPVIDPASPHSSLLHGILALMLVPPALFAPWPHRAAPLLAAIGLLCAALAPRAPRTSSAGHGLTLAGLIYGAQDLALWTYQHWTARSHELPWPFPSLLHGVLNLLGSHAGRVDTNLVLPTMRENHNLGATWDLFLDPPTLCFLAGSLIVLLLAIRPAATTAARKSGSKPSRKSRPASRPGLLERIPALRAIGLWFLTALLWLPLRAGLLLGAYLHRALRTDYDASFNLMPQFWNPWIQILCLLPLVLLQARVVRPVPLKTLAATLNPLPFWRKPALLPASLAAACALFLTLGVLWDPAGNRKGGRIAVDEFHSDWEPTERPFDTEWYGHLSGYNYACIYDYASRFYDMSRLTNAINDDALANLDVLVVKVPTEQYALQEVEAIVRFVDRGGGLLLVGEHTDVFGTGRNINSIARRFGFAFRYDCLFGIESFFDQYYVPSFTPHPVVQHIREMDFATSCSIDPGGGSGRGVITSTGLKNSMADYHVSNYYPPAADHAAMRYGAFVQLWATRHGNGRVLAFTDSTIFSNFATFEPGKAELMLGMLEWLNYQDAIGNPRRLLVTLALALLLLTLYRLRQTPGATLPAAAAAALLWTATAASLTALQRHQLPPPKPIRPFVQVTIDRTVSHCPLSKNGFIEGKPDGFGIFERWILRLGYFNRRASGPEALAGDLVVMPFPTRTASPEYLETLTRYVDSGGHVLILDSPQNTNSTAAALLEPFQLSQRPASLAGTVTGPEGFPSIPVESANEVLGGEPLFHLNNVPVGSTARHGQGSVTLIGFGSRFTDVRMGVTGDVEPDEALRKVFDVQFALLRRIIEGASPVRPPHPSAANH